MELAYYIFATTEGAAIQIISFLEPIQKICVNGMRKTDSLKEENLA